MRLERQKAVAFSGYRASKMADGLQDAELKAKMQEQLCETINRLLDKGYDTFLTGMADGFDLMAGEMVLRVKTQRPDTKLVAVMPFAGQSKKYSSSDAQIFDNVLSQADLTFILADHFSRYAFLVRNDFLVDNSSVLVCYFTGLAGGTKYTYDRAVKRGLEIINIAPNFSYNLKLF